MKFKLKPNLLVALLLYLIFLFYFFHKVDFTALYSILQHARTIYLFLAVMAGFFMVYCQAYLLYTLFSLYKQSVGYLECLSLWLVAIVVSTFTVGLGGPAMFYLHAKKQGDHKLATHLTTAFYIFYGAPNIAFVVLGGLILLPSSVLVNNIAYLLLIIGVSLIVVSLILVSISTRVSRLFSDVRKAINHFSVFQALGTISISLLEVVFNFLIFFFVIKAFQIPLSLISILKNFIIVELLAIFSPSSGGVGAVELGLTGSLAISGVATSAAAAVVLIYRFINFWLPFLAGGLLFGSQSKRVL